MHLHPPLQTRAPLAIPSLLSRTPLLDVGRHTIGVERLLYSSLTCVLGWRSFEENEKIIDSGENITVQHFTTWLLRCILDFELAAAHRIASIYLILKEDYVLLVGMFSTVATCFECWRPAFWLERAVTKPTVLPAGQELADHRVGAA